MLSPLLFIMNSKTLCSITHQMYFGAYKGRAALQGPWTLEVPSFCQTFDDEPRLAIRKAKACSDTI